jgi:hypothetical protein
MLPALLSVLLVAASIDARELVKPVDVLAAMADRQSGCLSVVEGSRVDAPTPHLQFSVQADPPGGGWPGWTPSLEHFLSLGETHAHPRQPAVTLALASLTDDLPQHGRGASESGRDRRLLRERALIALRTALSLNRWICDALVPVSEFGLFRPTFRYMSL